jgi:hypothetical protein
MALSAPNQLLVARASRRYVEHALGSARPFFMSNRWLGKSNRYSKDVIRTLAADLTTGAVNKRNLAQYVAVSSLLHCSDGWGYLGRAIQALISGDSHSCLHLAYYAELRAAMSLLATEGIGIFNDRHFVVDAPFNVVPVPGKHSTHRFAWECLSAWSRRPGSADLFVSTVRPHMRSLEDWLNPVGGGQSVRPQARTWFKQWGMDLEVFAKDRDARNIASYRPHGIPEPSRLDAREVAEFLSGLWSCLEPAEATSFEVIDRHVLRFSIEKLFLGRTGLRPEQDSANFQRLVQSVVGFQNFTQPVASGWEQFLARTISPNDPTIFPSSKIRPTAKDRSFYGVVSRAVLLLRMASGSTAQLFEAAGVAKPSIGFWRDQVGVTHGLWSPGDMPAAMTDLWKDISDALQELEAFSQLPQADTTFHRLNSTIAQSIVSVGRCERVALWTLATA